MMMKPVKTSLIALAVCAAAAFSAPGASALDQTRSLYNALTPKAAGRDRVPASYRIMRDETRQAPEVEASSRYFGGEIRTLIVDGRPVRLSEREIIENIRSGRFVPVYSETGTRLSREDWEVSLPHWLGYATRDYAGQ